MFRFLPKTLKHQAVAAFFIIGLLTFGNIIIIKNLLQQSNSIATTVNTAGKMRMIGQRIGLEAVAFSLIPQGNRPQSLKHKEEFEAAYKALSDSGFIFGQYVPALPPEHQPTLNYVYQAWIDYRTALNSLWRHDQSQNDKSLITKDSSIYALAVINASESLLDRTESLVTELVSYAQNKQNQVLDSAYVLLGLDILVLIAAYIIFIRRVQNPIQLLVHQCHQLASGNYAARSNLKHTDELGILGNALNASAENVSNLIEQVRAEQAALQQSNDIFNGLSANTLVGIYMLDSTLKFTYVNEHAANMIGCTPADLLNNFEIGDLLPANKKHKILSDVYACLTNKVAATNWETKVQYNNNKPVHVEFFCSGMTLNKQPVVIGIMHDITKRRQAEESERRAALVYKHTSEAMVVTDADGIVQDINPAFTIITGYRANEIIGKNMNIMSSGKHDKQFYRDMWDSITKTGYWSGDIQNVRKSGEEFIEHLTINTSYNHDGTVNCRIGLFSDVTEQRELQASVWHQAHYDALTQLPNRQMFYDNLRQTIDLSHNNNIQFALLFLDLDDFKDVNDTYGHEDGDELLNIVAQRLLGCVRPTDLVSRLGGDEFTIIVQNLKNLSDIEFIAEKILNSISKPYAIRENTVHVSASIGIAFFPRDSSDAAELLKRADLAMYEAKKDGRNQYRIFSAVMLKNVVTRRELMAEMNSALEEEQFTLHYQPIIDMQTGKTVKAEALIRWNHPTRGLIGPLEFISLAEETSQIVAIGNWVFNQAMKQAVEWHDQFQSNFSININVSPIQFMHDGLNTNEWIHALARNGLSGAALVVEITESLLMEVNDEVRARLMAFKHAGIKVALDDFGTGYSSLLHLKQLDIDILKIDRSFVRNLGSNPEDLALCQGIIVMAHQLGMKVIAEGVNSQRHHDLLKEAGCDYGQGFWYAKPMTATEITARIQAEHMPA